MKEYYLVSEVAELHHITRKTLHYYDRIGLFCPDYIDDETGYRYYSQKRFPYLKQIIYLKDLGFPLSEIKKLLDERDIEILLKALHQREEEVDRELSLLLHRKEDLSFLTSFYEQVKHLDEKDLYKPSIELVDERLISYDLLETETSREAVMMSYRKLLKTLTEKELFSQMLYGTIYFDADDLQHQAGSFITLPEPLGLDDEMSQPAGKYVSMFKKGGYHDPQSIDYFIKWIHQQGYELDGPIFDYCLIDYTFTDCEDEMIQKLQVKVR